MGSLPEKQSTSCKASYASFLAQYPAYKDTSALDRVRKDDYSRLDKAKEVYVDYMGGCLWPKGLVTGHASLLESGLFGNTHSDSPWSVYCPSEHDFDLC
jgi:molybdenum cofactor sulfurtransferase